MNDSIYDKLEKVYRLVNSGATEGERSAAKKALDRLLEKYNLDVGVLNDIQLRNYVFKYGTDLELQLLQRIMHIMAPEAISNSARGVKTIHSKLKYLDWITIESAYEYFRGHMKGQWKKLVSRGLAKCRKAKTKNRRRKEVNKIFFSAYVIASKLYREGELSSVGSMSKQELADRRRMAGLEGGSYNRQLSGGLLLEA